MMAAPGQSPWEVGRTRQAAKAKEGQIVVIDEGAGALSGLTGYPIGPDPEPTGGLPAMFVPLQELENLAPNSWYVNVLATVPGARGRGHGRRLLDLGEEIARAQDLREMSIIVEDTNAGAWRLYRASGYTERARRPIVKDGWQTDGQEWVLLTKPLP